MVAKNIVNAIEKEIIKQNTIFLILFNKSLISNIATFSFVNSYLLKVIKIAFLKFKLSFVVL